MILNSQKVGTTLAKLMSLFKNEENIYIKNSSIQEIITYKIISNVDITDKTELLKETFSNLCIITKEKENVNLYFSETGEEKLEELIGRIKETVSQNNAAEKEMQKQSEAEADQQETEEERKRLEEEELKRIEEEKRLAAEKAEEDELEREILSIIENKKTVRAIKEKCEDIGQLTYVLKNNINFMAVYYIFSENIELEQGKYAQIFDRYKDLSERYVRVKEYDIQYEEVTKKYFEKQLAEIEAVYNLLYHSWKIFQAEKKFSKKRFEEVKKLFPKNTLEGINKRDIFGFRKKVEI